MLVNIHEDFFNIYSLLSENWMVIIDPPPILAAFRTRSASAGSASLPGRPQTNPCLIFHGAARAQVSDINHLPQES